ncbi:vitamin B12-dependent ribonucleotide reductase [Acetobacter sp. AN02]|uniref:TSCPD domain-containing protein n=1 Tax=Acetobacter sp. AN02 TaxID=2894186 RepID=UPI0024342C80|nr:vitamin B12-dependent ribonucleotide reductase [Acetobacter sp. AN02]MDG6095748.1 vitamin B12-dependent ribonucleotide reductase [Acetobacter sp. AN02]
MNATTRYWTGVQMHTLQASSDPDEPLRDVTLPEGWDDDAAAALVQLSSGTGRDSADPVSFADLSTAWISRLVHSVADPESNGRSLAWMLLLRQAAPVASVWTGEYDRRPGFIVNLGAFVVPGEGFAGETFVAALRLICTLLRRHAGSSAEERNGELDLLLAPLPQKAPAEPELPVTGPIVAGDILLTNLDVCLAGLGFDYDSETGRDAACALVSLATLVAREGTGCDTLPLPPVRNVIPGLAPVAREAWSRAATETDKPEARIETGFSVPGPVDALLGSEACGLAPVYSPLRPDGRLAASTLARLAARQITLEAAFAAQLAGDRVLNLPGPDAHPAMYRALTGFADRLPARPDAGAPLPAALMPRGVARTLPARHGGIMQKASIGGHRLFLRTGEYEDGTPGEIAITPGRESPMVKGLMECFSEAVSIGLQYGAPLEDYVRRFAYSCFGPSGTVEGDPVAGYATSLLDYAFRALSDIYLGQRLPDAPRENVPADADPLLPMELPRGTPSHRRGLRLVS